MTYKINVANASEAQRLNRIAEKMPFEVWIHGKSGAADAKSILGMMLLTMESELTLVVDDSADQSDVEKKFADFIV